ncbi:hypothetical protein ISS98_12885 [Dyella flagellata]
MAYPFLLKAFHITVGPPGSQPSLLAIIGAVIILASAFAVPMLGIALACRSDVNPSFRRLAYASVLSPTLYVFLGVVQGMLRSPLPDELVWCVIWLGMAVWAWRAKTRLLAPAGSVTRWRVLHGITASILCLYVFFHLGNHLFGLISPQAHAAVMKAGRKVYRAPVIEPVLVALLLWQVASGLRLAWRWSTSAQGFQRTFQVASGAYLAVFVLGHMNSVFVYARTYLHIPTDWNFATGAPTGLIHDAWNIRLLPHYALGVFFVLSHLGSGLRAVLIAHGVDQRFADRLWTCCAAASIVISAAIMAGLCGVRIELHASVMPLPAVH